MWPCYVMSCLTRLVRSGITEICVLTFCSGDFAMLLKAGMSVRQAIFYNILSSILSFIGMATGILLGGISDVTPWIFSATAGIFLYVVNVLSI